MNGWWVDQFVKENRDGQNIITTKCDLKLCGICNRVYSRIGLTKKLRYYTRHEVPYYGHPIKVCRNCKEK